MNKKEIQYIIDNENSDIARLILGKREEGINFQLCIKCIEARKKIKTKVPQWYSRTSLEYPLSLSVEQCSSQATAQYKFSIAKRIIDNLKNDTRKRVKNKLSIENYDDGLHQISNSFNNIADITGGMGVDSHFISGAAEKLFYFEKNRELCNAAEYNLSELGNNKVVVKNLDIERNIGVLDGKNIGLVYADPARRESAVNNSKNKVKAAGKLVSIKDYEPDILKLKNELFKYSPYILLKISPMADIKLTLNLLPQTEEIHIISVNNECKELLFLLHDECHKKPEIIAVNLIDEGKSGNTGSFCFTFDEEENESAEFADITPDDDNCMLLLEPNKSILKAGAFKTISKRFGLRKIAPSTHLYTAEISRESALLSSFPGKVFTIKSVYKYNKQNIKTLNKIVPKANLCARNFPINTDSLKKVLKVTDGGNEFLFAVTCNSGEKVIIHCRPCGHNL